MRKSIIVLLVSLLITPVYAADWELSDPGYDAIVFWDDSASGSEVVWMPYGQYTDGTDTHLVQSVQEAGLGGRLTTGVDISTRTAIQCDYGVESTDFGLSANAFGHQKFWMDADEDSWIYVSWTADDTPGVYVGGSATTLALPNAELSFPITHEEDSGAIVIHNMSVSATPADGTEQSYTIQIDSNNILKVYGEADSAGGSDTHKVIAYPSSTSGAGVNLTREQNSQAFDNGETQTTVTAAHMLGAKYITDQGGSAETDVILTAVSYYIDCIVVETEGNGWEICPPSGEALYLDGTAIAADDCVDGGGTVGDRAALSRAQIADGSYKYFINTIIGTWSDGNDTGD